MKVYSFTCASCQFTARHQVGTPDGDQVLTDLNTEFAFYNLFTCLKEKKFVSTNVLDPTFDAKCPSDGTDLQPVDMYQPTCPRCGSRLAVDQSRPLSAADSSAE